MTKIHTCETCQQPVANNEAVLRGNAIDPEPRAWHPGCYPTFLVPAQRHGDHDRLPDVWPPVERIPAQRA